MSSGVAGMLAGNRSRLGCQTKVSAPEAVSIAGTLPAVPHMGCQETQPQPGRSAFRRARLDRVAPAARVLVVLDSQSGRLRVKNSGHMQQKQPVDEKKETSA